MRFIQIQFTPYMTSGAGEGVHYFLISFFRIKKARGILLSADLSVLIIYCFRVLCRLYLLAKGRSFFTRTVAAAIFIASPIRNGTTHMRSAALRSVPLMCMNHAVPRA